jgi:predicted RNA-binding Zn ribbon-like protein
VHQPQAPVVIAEPAKSRASSSPKAGRRRSATRPPRAMPIERARAIAERAHRGQVEASGRPHIHHVRRVAAAAPEVAGVAWLHNSLEWTDVGEEDLVAAGLAPQEVAALRLLTRPDEDRFRLPRDPGGAWIPPYARALEILARGASDREQEASST